MSVKFNNWVESAGVTVQLASVPELSYDCFGDELCAMVSGGDGGGGAGCYVLAYFGVPCGAGLRVYCVVADDECGVWRAVSWVLDYYGDAVWPISLVGRVPQMAVFEREICELWGVQFVEHPWLKPLRYPFNRFDPSFTTDNYPFFDIDDRELHHVNVGPVHAGIIEPGVFRFVCRGEQVLHMEVALGYQHRGVESLIVNAHNGLRRIALGESIAGDSVVGHAVAMARLMEGGDSGRCLNYEQLNRERCVALEMERMAMHLADVGALCMDIAYQMGQVTCEALRTMVINTQQRWSGSRFAKGLVRPWGTNFPLTAPKCEMVLGVLGEVSARFERVADVILTDPTVLLRLEEVCVVSRDQALAVGAVGVAARASGVVRDVRGSHPFVRFDDFKSVVCDGGDLLSRVKVRVLEVRQSYELIKSLLGCEVSAGAPVSFAGGVRELSVPDYERAMEYEVLGVSMVEGWRGVICHVAVTDERGEPVVYKVYDPSMHNWKMLELSVRGAEISDFPVSNKSFNLSYCGHDL